jgi:hypothetical protein
MGRPRTGARRRSGAAGERRRRGASRAAQSGRPAACRFPRRPVQRSPGGGRGPGHRGNGRQPGPLRLGPGAVLGAGRYACVLRSGCAARPRGCSCHRSRRRSGPRLGGAERNQRGGRRRSRSARQRRSRRVPRGRALGARPHHRSRADGQPASWERADSRSRELGRLEGGGGSTGPWACHGRGFGGRRGCRRAPGVGISGRDPAERTFAQPSCAARAGTRHGGCCHRGCCHRGCWGNPGRWGKRGGGRLSARVRRSSTPAGSTRPGGSARSSSPRCGDTAGAGRGRGSCRYANTSIRRPNGGIGATGGGRARRRARSCGAPRRSAGLRPPVDLRSI